MAESSEPTAYAIREAYALHRINADDDRESLSIEQCRERVAAYRADFDRWAAAHGIEVVVEEIVPVPLEVGPHV